MLIGTKTYQQFQNYSKINLSVIQNNNNNMRFNAYLNKRLLEICYIII